MRTWWLHRMGQVSGMIASDDWMCPSLFFANTWCLKIRIADSQLWHLCCFSTSNLWSMCGLCATPCNNDLCCCLNISEPVSSNNMYGLHITSKYRSKIYKCWTELMYCTCALQLLLSVSVCTEHVYGCKFGYMLIISTCVNALCVSFRAQLYSFRCLGRLGLLLPVGFLKQTPTMWCQCQSWLHHVTNLSDCRSLVHTQVFFGLHLVLLYLFMCSKIVVLFFWNSLEPYGCGFALRSRL